MALKPFVSLFFLSGLIRFRSTYHKARAHFLSTPDKSMWGGLKNVIIWRTQGFSELTEHFPGGVVCPCGTSRLLKGCSHCLYEQLHLASLCFLGSYCAIII